MNRYYAQIDDDNVVLNVVVASPEFMAENPDRYPGTWVETFINLPNKTYAGVGYTYNETTNDFTAPIEPPMPAPPLPTNGT